MMVEHIEHRLIQTSIEPIALAITRNINLGELKRFTDIPIAIIMHIYKNRVIVDPLLAINGLIIINIVDNDVDNNLITDEILKSCAIECINLWAYYGFMPLFAGWQIDSLYLDLSGFDWPVFYQHIYHTIPIDVYAAIKLELASYLAAAGQSRDQVHTYLRSQLLKERIV